MAQHRNLIQRLEEAGKIIEEHRLNTLELAKEKGGLGIIICGAVISYLEEGLNILSQYGDARKGLSILKVVSSNPYPGKEIKMLLSHCNKILVLEELEAYIEKNVYVEAQQMRYTGQIIGKVNGALSRIGEYDVQQVVKGIGLAQGIILPEGLFSSDGEAEKIATARPITTCAGCPHRGTFMAINQAIRKLKLKQDQVMVTGDIGCTILGMNPPYNTVWNEVSMGASISLAQGFVHAGVETPVIATIGDSTFFHAGIPGLINAIQHNVNLTLVIMDNRWTAMTGMQVNPGTPGCLQNCDYKEVDIARIIPALGVEQFWVIDPLDYNNSTNVIQQAMTLPGVKVVLARQECAIQFKRREDNTSVIEVVSSNCNLCKLCVMITGCAALSLGEEAVVIDPALCTACGLCVEVCNRNALVVKEK